MAAEPRAPSPLPFSDLDIIEKLEEIEESIVLPSFTAATAWTLGCALRERLLEFPKPACVSITHANSNQLLFHTVTRAGTSPDNDLWVARKRRTVLRWGHSSWWMNLKMQGNEAKFAEKYMLGESAGEYAIHGGGWPIRVRGVDGLVAVVVVSVLKQEEDNEVIMEVLTEYLNGLDHVATGGK